MRNLEIKTKKSPAEVIERLKAFFGPGGLGLDLVEDKDGCLTFRGGGGYVQASVSRTDEKTVIGLVSQEWERTLDQFARSL